MGNDNTQIISSQRVINKTLISFLFFFLFIASCIALWKWIYKQPADNGTPKPLRTVLNTNEKIFSSVFSDNHLTKTYPLSPSNNHSHAKSKIGFNFKTRFVYYTQTILPHKLTRCQPKDGEHCARSLLGRIQHME